MSMITSSLSYSHYSDDQEKRKIFNQYMNEYNYFNKNNIKMSHIRKKKFDKIKSERKKESKKLFLPKMIYSNFYLVGNTKATVTSDKIKYNKDTLEQAVRYYTEENLQNSSHAKKPFYFDDLLDCVDELDLGVFEELGDEKEKYKDNALQKDLKIDTTNLNPLSFQNKKIETEREKNDNLDRKTQVALATEISSDSLANKIKKQPQNFKNNLQFNNFGKYKYTGDGVAYPDKLNKEGLPEYKGNDSQEKEYFNYRKKVNNPNKIYNSIGSFNEKFNRELGRISRSYGSEKSRGRFVSNPLLNSYKDQIPYYDLYKDIKFIENRYSDNKRYKYRLLPLINTKLRNFDRLGHRIYQNTMMKKGPELEIMHRKYLY